MDAGHFRCRGKKPCVAVRSRAVQRGKGMAPMRDSGIGDIYIQAVVETPVNLSRKQQEMPREFERSAGEQTSPESAGFFARVKELWDDLRE